MLFHSDKLYNLFGKIFYFQNKQNNNVPNIHVFKYYLSNRIKIEKELALLNDKLAFFNTNGEKF